MIDNALSVVHKNRRDGSNFKFKKLVWDDVDDGLIAPELFDVGPRPGNIVCALFDDVCEYVKV